MSPRYIYDLETFCNIFLFVGKFEGTSEFQIFEISDRRNDLDALLSWLSYLENSKTLMVGFNNLGFDHPIIYWILNNKYIVNAKAIYLEAQKIIESQRFGAQRPYQMREKDRVIPQCDLFKINHFDNPAKSTRLKDLQFAMRSESVEDLPYSPHEPLTFAQMDELRSYGCHDVTETEAFYFKCKHLIAIRQEFIDQGILSGDVLNWSDVKMGTEYLVKKIGRSKCYDGSIAKNSKREEVTFKEIILPKIFFRDEKFEAVLDWFKSKTWYKDEEEHAKLEANLAGLSFHFGVGGVHASVESKFYESNDEYVIRDIDVSGMYPAVAIANGFCPEHLGQDFLVAYKQLQLDRKLYKKGTAMNLILKLAGNGAFGNSNNPFSPLYDPKFTFSITVNGQLQLLQLVEVLSLIPGLEIIQANTDGITAFLPREISYLFDLWKLDWESNTGLKLEDVEYSKMWIADVNNYLAIDTKGNVKRKGRYWYPTCDEDYHGSSGTNYNKDFSNMSAQKGVEAVLTLGYDPEDVVRLISNPFDFMLRYKTKGDAKVFLGDREMLKTVRYYVSTAGEKMQKVSQPKGEIGSWKRKNGLSDSEYNRILSTVPQGAWDERIHTKNKSKYVEVVTSIESGRLVRECNDSRNFRWDDIDYSYYVQEIKKLIIGGSNVLT